MTFERYKRFSDYLMENPNLDKTMKELLLEILISLVDFEVYKNDMANEIDNLLGRMKQVARILEE